MSNNIFESEKTLFRTNTDRYIIFISLSVPLLPSVSLFSLSSTHFCLYLCQSFLNVMLICVVVSVQKILYTVALLLFWRMSFTCYAHINARYRLGLDQFHFRNCRLFCCYVFKQGFHLSWLRMDALTVGVLFLFLKHWICQQFTHFNPTDAVLRSLQISNLINWNIKL